MGLPGVEVMGKLNPTQQGPIFTLVVLDKPDWESILEELDIPKRGLKIPWFL